MVKTIECSHASESLTGRHLHIIFMGVTDPLYPPDNPAAAVIREANAALRAEFDASRAAIGEGPIAAFLEQIQTEGYEVWYVGIARGVHGGRQAQISKGDVSATITAVRYEDETAFFVHRSDIDAPVGHYAPPGRPFEREMATPEDVVADLTQWKEANSAAAAIAAAEAGAAQSGAPLWKRLLGLS
jgi:hypothetical protein